MMANANREFVPRYTVPPGETIRELLGEHGMTQAELARQMGRPESTISQIVNGKKRIEPQTALQLADVLDMPAHFWVNLQANYDLNVARQEEREKRLREEADTVSLFPYAKMASHGWVEETRKKMKKAENLLSFFGADSLSTIDTSPAAALRVAERDKVDEYALIAWLRQGQLCAHEVETEPFSEDRLEESMGAIRALTCRQPHDFQPQLNRILQSCGVVPVVLPHLPRTYAQGATQWIDEDKAVCQVTIRYRWADIFWFSLFHELGHLILHGHQREVFISLENDEETDELEKEADKFAEDMLIPADSLQEFLECGDISSAAICRFAAEIGIAPGIVVGRLQNDGVLDYWDPQERLRQKYKFTDE